MGAPSRPLRLGAVSYLNARPLTWALDSQPERWHVRYDLPSMCANLLASREVDLALVPSVEYLQSDDYRFVPGVGIGSRGPVASVALFARKPVGDIRTIALDTSSRTSVALVRVLCRHRFHIEPQFAPHHPDLQTMLEVYDAALMIGDPALETDAAAIGVTKIDLGLQWTEMTGLPFIYAAWTGRAGVASAADVAALQAAQGEGVASFEAIAAEYAPGDTAKGARALDYLRDNMKYGLGADEAAGLQLFLDHAADLGLAPRRRPLEFF
jgi:chorismate dehydratase